MKTGKDRSLFLANVTAILIFVSGVTAYFLGFSHDDVSGDRNHTRPTEAPALQTIEHVTYRKTSEFDPGTIRVYLRNTTNQEMAFDKVLLDGLPIPVWGADLKVESLAPDAQPTYVPPESADIDDEEHVGVYESAAAKYSGKRVLWAKIEPFVIPPNGIGEFAAKLVNPLPRPMKVEFIRPSDETLCAIVRPLGQALTIVGVTFSEDLKRVYVYTENASEAELRISGLEFNGVWLLPNQPADAGAPASTRSLWLSSQTVAGREIGLAVIDIAQPLVQGDSVTIRAVCTDGSTAEERVRVQAGFPLARESGSGGEELGLSGDSYSRHRGYTASVASNELPSSPPPPSLQGNLLFVCQMHSFGADHERSARETLRRNFTMQTADPRHLNSIHLCRVRPEVGYALFAETADILRINPNITTGLSRPNGKEMPEDTVARITEYAILAARPHPVHSLADTSSLHAQGKLAHPDEFRRRIYAVLGCGVKGLLYRHHEGGNIFPAALKDEASRINAEIAHVRELLAIAQPVPWVTAQDKRLFFVRSLLVGRKGLLVLVVRREQAPGSDPRSVQEISAPGGAPGLVALHLSLPAWVTPVGMEAVSQEGLSGLPKPSLDAQTGTVSLPLDQVAGMFFASFAGEGHE